MRRGVLLATAVGVAAASAHDVGTAAEATKARRRRRAIPLFPRGLPSSRDSEPDNPAFAVNLFNWLASCGQPVPVEESSWGRSRPRTAERATVGSPCYRVSSGDPFGYAPGGFSRLSRFQHVSKY